MGLLNLMKKKLSNPRVRFKTKLLLAEIATLPIEKFFVRNNMPCVELKDGTILSSYWSSGLDPIAFLKTSKYPLGFEKLLFDLVLHYKYPHSMPYLEMPYSKIFRKLSYVHPQHVNTLSDLGNFDDQRYFAETLSVGYGDVVLEVGAHIGFGTVRLSRQVGPDGKVIACEVDPAICKIHETNSGLNKLTNIDLKTIGIGREKGQMTLYKKYRQGNTIVQGVVESKSNTTAEIDTLSSIMNSVGLEPKLIVLTINGAELDALVGGRDFLANLQDCAIISAGWYRDNEGIIGPRIIKLLRELGYRVAATKGMHIFAHKL